MIGLGWMTLDLVEEVPRQLLDVIFKFINFPVNMHGIISHLPWRIHHDMEDFPTVCVFFMSRVLGYDVLAFRVGANQGGNRGCCAPPPSVQIFVALSHK
ncbi:hypothetical protein AVEN_142240-1 [Araneus ventricosus]|uniref:Uncharacterized protein n=1 Tax=Araneus ventricosus TaxID=182803 RepID=A0A4Y2L7W0_ARAVE|nr:hypothetical protein AVEN_142240-1 [Araneus ventricosus]